MKKIIIDDEIFSIQNTFGGISRLITEYIAMFDNDEEINFSLPFDYSNNKHLNLTKFKKKKFFPNLNIPKKTNIIRLLNKKQLYKTIDKGDYDILLLSYMDTNLIKKNKKKLISVVHDTIPEDTQKYFKNIDLFKMKKKEILEKSDKVITVSNYTKENLIKLYNVNEDKLTVIHPHLIKNKSIKKIKLPNNFILFVGNRDLYKNFNFLINSISKIGEVNVVCVGGKKFSNNEKKLLIKKNLVHRFNQYDLSDEELNFCYRKSICHVILSEAEGFGVTILEAQKNNCKILCSSLSIFNEVGEQSLLYFKLNNEDDFLKKLTQIINGNYSKNIYKNMINNLKRFEVNDAKKKLDQVFKYI